jgi:hypothetical protein
VPNGQAKQKTTNGIWRPIKTPESPNRILCLVLVSGPDTKGTLYILVCTNKFCKHVTYIPFEKTLNSKTISTELNKRIFSRFGYLKVIITDRGPKFKIKNGRKRWGSGKPQHAPQQQHTHNLIDKANAQFRHYCTT